jgi:hypothetical protein
MRFEVQGNFKAALLSDELVTAFPQLIEERGGERFSIFTLTYLDSVLRFSTTLQLDEAALSAVIAAHNPNGKSKNERRAERYEARRRAIADRFLALGFTDEELSFMQQFFADLAGKE